MWPSAAAARRGDQEFDSVHGVVYGQPARPRTMGMVGETTKSVGRHDWASIHFQQPTGTTCAWYE